MTSANSIQAEDLHVIIAGDAPVGHRTARLLEDYGHDAYLIDPDPEATSGAMEMLRSTVIEGEPTRTFLRRRTPSGPTSSPS